MSETQRARRELEAMSKARKEGEKTGKYDAAIRMLEVLVSETNLFCEDEVFIMCFGKIEGRDGMKEISQVSIDRVNEFLAPSYKILKAEEEKKDV